MTLLTKNFTTLKTQVAAHIEADAVIGGHYWIENNNAVGGSGCFIGCLAHSNKALDVQHMFGLPLAVVRIAENIFESLSEKDGRAFFSAIPDAVGSDGKDLGLVHWAFIASELRNLPPVPSRIQDVIDPIIVGIDLLAGGGEWAAAVAAYDVDVDVAVAHAADAYAAVAYARAAARAAYAVAAAAAVDVVAFAAAHAAYAAYAAARAAYAARDAADAASYAVRLRQRDTLLRLISEAPMSGDTQ
mgnify:CR=1 FL=1